LDYLEKLPDEIRVLVERAYSDACQVALLVCTGLAVCAILSSYFMREKRK